VSTCRGSAAARHDVSMRTAAELPDDIRALIVEGRDAWRDHDHAKARSLFEAAEIAVIMRGQAKPVALGQGIRDRRFGATPPETPQNL
jgi:hypothetical protein